MERSLDSARDDRREGYGRDDGRDQGRDENQRILYFRGFRAIDGRDGGFLIKNEYFQTSQRHLTTFSASAYEFLSVRYGDADTFLTTFQQFPPWEHFIPTVGTNALEPVLSSCPYLISRLNHTHHYLHSLFLCDSFQKCSPTGVTPSGEHKEQGLHPCRPRSNTNSN